MLENIINCNQSDFFVLLRRFVMFAECSSFLARCDTSAFLWWLPSAVMELSIGWSASSVEFDFRLHVVVSSSHQSPSWGVSLFRSAQSIMILLSLWSASKGSQKCGGCHEANDNSHGNGCALSGRFCSCTDLGFGSDRCAVLVFISSVCSAVATGGGRPLSSFDEQPSMAVMTASCWMLLMADLKLLSGSPARYCWMSDLSRPIKDRRQFGKCIFKILLRCCTFTAILLQCCV